MDSIADNLVWISFMMGVSITRPDKVQTYFKMITLKLVFDGYMTAIKTCTQGDLLDFVLPYTPLNHRRLIFQYIFGAILALIFYFDVLGRGKEQDQELGDDFKAVFERKIKGLGEAVGRKGGVDGAKYKEYLKKVEEVKGLVKELYQAGDSRNDQKNQERKNK